MRRFAGFAVGAMVLLAGCGGGGGGASVGGVAGNGGGTSQNYSTAFPRTENPIDEDGRWLNGKVDGTDWTDVQTSRGNAIGTQFREAEGTEYHDSVAVLDGTWGSDQTVEGVVHEANRTGTGASGWGGNEFGDCIHEVELILRGNIFPANIYLYEVLFSSRLDGTAYTEIVKWSGAQGNFTYLSRKWGTQYRVFDGDVVRASIVGNTIKVYLNNTLVATATDSVSPITQGSPGIGFFTNRGCTGGAHNEDFGFKSIAIRTTAGG